MSKHNPTGRTVRAAMGRAQGGGDDRTIRFVFSTPGVARDGHRILPGAWQSQGHDGLAAFRSNPVFLWAHDSEEPPIGRVIDIAESNGILSGAVTFAGTDFADTILRLYKDGFLNACSIGWTPVEGTPARGPDRAIGAYDFTKCELLEISGVPVPADVGALATARAAGLDLSPLAAWAERHLDMKDTNMPTSQLQALHRAAAGSAPRVFPIPKAPGASFRSLGEQMVSIARSRATGEIDPRLVRAPAGNGEIDPSGGGFLVADAFIPTLVESLYKESVLLPLCDQREIASPFASAKIPAIDETSRADGSRAGGSLSYWLSEAATITGSFPKFRELEFSAKKLAALCVVSGELAEDTPMLEAALGSAFASEMGFKIDQAILAGTGAGQPLGILNAPCKVKVAKESAQASGTILAENIRKMWSALPGPCRSRAVWLAHEQVEDQLDATAGGLSELYLPRGSMAGNDMPLLRGRPVVFVESASALGTEGDLVLADLSQYIVVTSGLKLSLSVDVQFTSYQTVYRFIARIDGQPAWASPITPFAGSGQRSPFVTLAAR